MIDLTYTHKTWGGSEKRFYRSLIAAADKQFDEHLAQQGKVG